MAQNTLTITQGTPPYTISITEVGTGTPISCTSGCASSNTTNRTITYTTLSGVRNYRVQVTDSATPPCSTYQFTGNVNCDTVSAAPNYTLSVQQPTCGGTVLSQFATITLNNVTNGNRYHYYQNTQVDVNDCNGANAFSGSTYAFNVPSPPQGTSQVFTIRMWGGTDCSLFTDRSITVTSPTCGTTCTIGLTLGQATC